MSCTDSDCVWSTNSPSKVSPQKGQSTSSVKTCVKGLSSESKALGKRDPEVDKKAAEAAIEAPAQ